MIEKERLRKADIFVSVLIFLFGAWIVKQAFKMPMKDSWGGVMNVWFVSPALLPLFIGTMVMILATLLCRTALKTVGTEALGRTIRWLLSRHVIQYLVSEPILRFYTIVILFLSLVYMNIPRIDFLLSSILFLIVFFTIFYFDDPVLLKKLLFLYLAGVMGFVIYFAAGLDSSLGKVLPYASDLLALWFILAYCFYAWILVRSNPKLRKKFRTSLVVAVSAPFICAPIFKYFLLVPLPAEGLIVALLDRIWYLEF